MIALHLRPPRSVHLLMSLAQSEMYAQDNTTCTLVSVIDIIITSLWLETCVAGTDTTIEAKEAAIKKRETISPGPRATTEHELLK